MAERAEALAQISRLLGDPRLRSAPVEEARAHAEAAFEKLVEGLVEEAAASDDVTDRQSATAYLGDRLSFLGDVLGGALCEQLRDTLRQRVAEW